MTKRRVINVFRHTAISVAVGMCLSSVVHAQSAEGTITGKAKAGACTTLERHIPTATEIAVRRNTLITLRFVISITPC